MLTSLYSKKRIIFNLTSKLGFVSLGKLVGIITIPIITQSLGPEQFGIYNFVLTIAGYAFLPANWGFLAKGIREVAKMPDSSEKIVEKILSARLSLWFFGGLISIFIFFFFSKDVTLFWYIILALFTNLGISLTIDFYFYGIKETFPPSVSHFLGQLVFLLLVFLFIRGKNDLSTLLFINLFYRLIEALFLIFLYYRKNKRIKLVFPSIAGLNFLKENFLLGLGAKGSFFLNSYPILIIPIFMSPYELGVYSATFKLFLILSLLLQSINLVFSPWIVESKYASPKRKKQIFKKLLLGYCSIGIMGSALLYFFGPLIADLFLGEEFYKTQNLIKTFALFLTPIWPIYMLLVGYMNNYEKDKHYFVGTLIQIGTILPLVPLGIYFWNLHGIILATGCTTFLVCLYYYIKIKIELKIEYEK